MTFQGHVSSKNNTNSDHSHHTNYSHNNIENLKGSMNMFYYKVEKLLFRKYSGEDALEKICVQLKTSPFKFRSNLLKAVQLPYLRSIHVYNDIFE